MILITINAEKVPSGCLHVGGLTIHRAISLSEGAVATLANTHQLELMDAVRDGFITMTENGELYSLQCEYKEDKVFSGSFIADGKTIHVKDGIIIGVS